MSGDRSPFDDGREGLKRGAAESALTSLGGGGPDRGQRYVLGTNFRTAHDHWLAASGWRRWRWSFEVLKCAVLLRSPWRFGLWVYWGLSEPVGLVVRRYRRWRAERDAHALSEGDGGER